MRSALVIGTSAYADRSFSRLESPSLDARVVAKALAAPAIGGFDKVQTLIDSDERSMRRAIAGLFFRKRPNDLVLLYISGHGVLDEAGSLFFVATDTLLDELRATAVPASFVRGEMDLSMCRRQVVILDCCNSGAFGEGRKSADVVSIATDRALGEGRVILTASNATQFAWEGNATVTPSGHSVFTNFLVEGLQTGHADLNRDGAITVDELYVYAYDRVLQSGYAQTPLRFGAGEQGKLVLAHAQDAEADAVRTPQIRSRRWHAWPAVSAVLLFASGSIAIGSNDHGLATRWTLLVLIGLVVPALGIAGKGILTYPPAGNGFAYTTLAMTVLAAMASFGSFVEQDHLAADALAALAFIFAWVGIVLLQLGRYARRRALKVGDSIVGPGRLDVGPNLIHRCYVVLWSLAVSVAALTVEPIRVTNMRSILTVGTIISAGLVVGVAMSDASTSRIAPRMVSRFAMRLFLGILSAALIALLWAVATM